MEYLQSTGYKVILLVVNDWGNFRGNFEQKFETYYLNNPPKSSLDRFLKINQSTISVIDTRHNIDLIYVNTIASTHLIEELKSVFGAPVVSHIHELAYSISQFGHPDSLNQLFNFSDKIIACSQAVADNLQHYRKSENIEVIHSFVNNEEILKIHAESDREVVLKEFGLAPGFLWVCACGNADWRKAPDIFVQIAAKTQNPNIRFAWIGIKEDDPLKVQLAYDLAKFSASEKVVWITPTPKAVELINAMDYFLLCSREDPFPLVMLEAALCEKPVFAFKNTGGGDEFIGDDAGFRFNYLDSIAMAEALDGVDKEKAAKAGKKGQQKVLDNYSFEKSVLKIESLIESLIN